MAQIPASALRPMLATLADGPFDDSEWIYEIKWDGYRLIIVTEKGKTKLLTRNGIDVSERYPEICTAFSGSADSVIDGELVALSRDGKPSFEHLQNLDRFRSALVVYAFDLLYLGGKDMRDLPLIERKKRLRQILPDSPHVRYSEHIQGKGVAYFETAEQEGLEGIVAKRAESRYLSGTRSSDWLKIKTVQRQEAVVIGYTAPRASRKHIGSLVLAVRDKDSWKYVGHTGGSMGGKRLKEVYDMLQPLRIRKGYVDVPEDVERNVTWVTPQILVEVTYTEMTLGGLMRHPVIARFRGDKSAEQAVLEKALPHMEPAFSNPSKIYWPKEKYTKGDVIDYYNRMADIILPYLKGRPIVLNRHPNGIAKPGFYQKDSSDLNLPDFVESTIVHSESGDKDIPYVVCNNKETLLYLANLGCIEMNPWSSSLGSLERPDFYVIDLDPGENTFNEVIEAARAVHEILAIACEESYPKTSGKSGMHIYVPLQARYSYDSVRQFSELIVRMVHSRIPDLTSLERSPSKRKDKIYLDWLQNRTGQTLAAPYSLRPVEGALVSAPLEWREVKKGLDPRSFTIRTIFDRIDTKGDLWKPVLGKGVDLEKSIVCLQEELIKKRR